ncbi:MAG: cell division protein FtsL [Burkholderiaceae bacterium]
MTRLNLSLFIAVLVTMLYIVQVQYESRRLFVEIEKTTLDVRKLEIDNATLQVEKRAQATPLRIEKLAKERLHMRSAMPAVTQYLRSSRDDSSGELRK